VKRDKLYAEKVLLAQKIELLLLGYKKHFCRACEAESSL